MITYIKALLWVLLIFSTQQLPAQRVHIIPEPMEVIEKEGSFVFNAQTLICVASADTGMIKTVNLFRGKLEHMTGMLLPVKSNHSATSSNCIRIERHPDAGSREAYTLNITEKGIIIRASSTAGIFYGLESLLQTVTSHSINASATDKRKEKGWTSPCADISDMPRFPYRGMHLDVSRHFFPASYIKNYLDILAEFKINVFHWHLTDSHGWRLEIKKYPRLTTVGAWRADRPGIPMTVAEPTGKDEPAEYGGFYTQEEVKDIVQYARLRNIEIIPEIEMPGHCTAALVAYPQFSDLGNTVPLLMPCGYKGDLLHNFCAGYDSTYTFLEDILTEVIEIFPSGYVHIGGDEVRPGPWLGCSRCTERMKREGLKTARELQAYFTRRIDSFITARGKRMVGWDEILDADIEKSSVAMSWHGDSKAQEAAAKGNQVIMTPYWYTYFDFYQSPPDLEEYITYARLNIDSVYAFDPVPETFTEQQAKFILGGEGCLWTENIATEKRVEYMLLPRLCALAEALWTPVNRKDYSRFITKIERQFSSFDARDINYARSMYNVDIIPVYDSLLRKVRIRLTDQTYKYPIHYTLDGKNPTTRSLKYTAPFLLDESTIVKALAFKDHAAAGKINTDSFSLHKAVGGIISSEPAIAGINRLSDGIFGTGEPYDRRWVLITDSVLSANIDLEKERFLQRVSLRFMEDEAGNIFLPAAITISGSEDGIHYRNIYEGSHKTIPQNERRHTVIHNKLFTQKARYIRIVIRNAGLNKEKEKNIMLLDEIVIE